MQIAKSQQTHDVFRLRALGVAVGPCKWHKGKRVPCDWAFGPRVEIEDKDQDLQDMALK